MKILAFRVSLTPPAMASSMLIRKVPGLDMVIFFYSPLFTNSREPNIEMISKACDIYNIPIATNIATAESLVIGLQKGDLEWRENI